MSVIRTCSYNRNTVIRSFFWFPLIRKYLILASMHESYSGPAKIGSIKRRRLYNQIGIILMACHKLISNKIRAIMEKTKDKVINVLNGNNPIKQSQ